MLPASNEKRQTTLYTQNGTTKTKLEHSEKMKPTYDWGYWKLTLLNKMRWKKKLRKNISGEPESYSRQNYIEETLLKE